MTAAQAARLAGMAATRSAEVELFSLAGQDGLLREVNDAFAQLLGQTAAEVNGRSLLELVHPEDVPPIIAGLAALHDGASEVMLENRFMLGDGRTVHLQWVARPLPGTDLWWAAGRDTTEFHRLLGQRRDLGARLELALGQATAAMWDLDVRAERLSWEPQAAEVLGVATSSLPVRFEDIGAVVQTADAPAVSGAFRPLIDDGAIEVAFRVGDGATTRYLSLRGKVLDRDRRGRALRAVGLIVDVTAEKAMEEQMLRMVMSDALTGVPNRRAFDQALRTSSRRCTRELEPLSVIMVDIDNFKGFNDTFGHLVGDAALVAVARSLAGVIERTDDVLARFGGEEFALVLPGIDEAGAAVVAGRLVRAIREVKVRQAPGWALSISVGTATTATDGPAMKAVELLAQADRALYAAKSAGKDRALAYDAAMG